MTQSMLLPVAALAAWTLVMWIWMFATRIPAMQKAKVDPEKTKHSKDALNAVLPLDVRQVADNYNHLMEQPTVFYAVAIALAVSGEAAGVDLIFAWAYVLLRVAHSVWQATANIVMIRFFIFVASSLALFGLTGRALYLFAT